MKAAAAGLGLAIEADDLGRRARRVDDGPYLSHHDGLRTQCRWRGSHNPREHTSAAELEAGVRVLLDVVSQARR